MQNCRWSSSCINMAQRMLKLFLEEGYMDWFVPLIDAVATGDSAEAVGSSRTRQAAQTGSGRAEGGAYLL